MKFKSIHELNIILLLSFCLFYRDLRIEIKYWIKVYFMSFVFYGNENIVFMLSENGGNKKSYLTLRYVVPGAFSYSKTFDTSSFW